jgi:Xaa-Pro aminopeptidase
MIKKAQKKIKRNEAYLITDPSNIYYLSGFSGSRGILVLTKKHSFLITDFRYKRVSKKISKSIKTVIADKLFEELKKILTGQNIKKLNYEENDVTVKFLKSLKKNLKKIRLQGTSDFIEQLRITKTPAEIKFINKAKRITEKTFREVTKNIKSGMMEKEIAWEIEKTGRDNGADGTSFPPIVAFGKNSASPHHQSGNKKLKKGDLILIDMGFKYKGYCSDMTRILFTDFPTPLQKKIYNTVLKAQQEAIKNIKAGITGLKGDKFARDIIKKAGYGKEFGHSLGHGVGLKVHEAPLLSTKYRKTIPLNSVVTIEPGIYLENSFGIRIEDMVLVKHNKVINLTRIPKKIENLILSIS